MYQLQIKFTRYKVVILDDCFFLILTHQPASLRFYKRIKKQESRVQRHCSYSVKGMYPLWYYMNSFKERLFDSDQSLLFFNPIVKWSQSTTKEIERISLDTVKTELQWKWWNAGGIFTRLRFHWRME